MTNNNNNINTNNNTQATQNPAMFKDAMSMLGDPSAVKEAEAMMNDPEFKSEINQYMETLKNNSAFRDAMAEAQRKYQVGGGCHAGVFLLGVLGDFG